MKKIIFLVMCILSNIYICQAQKTPVRIGVNNNPPYISINKTATDTVYTGIVIDILKRSTFISYNFVWCPSKEDAISKLANKQVDLVANASMSFDRLSKFDATTQYMHSQIGICIKKPIIMNGIELIWFNIVKLKWTIVGIFICFYILFIIFGILFYVLDHFFQFIRTEEKFKMHDCINYMYFIFVAYFEGFEDKTKTSLSRFILMNKIMALQLIIIPLIIGMLLVEIQKSNDDINTISSMADLKKYNVLTIKGTSNESLLSQNMISYKSVISIDSALTLCSTGKYILVHDKAIMNWYIYNNNMKDVLSIMLFDIQVNDRVFLYNKGYKNPIINDLKINPLKLRETRELDFIMSQYNN